MTFRAAERNGRRKAHQPLNFEVYTAQRTKGVTTSERKSVCAYLYLWNFGTFSLISLRTHTVRTITEELKERHPNAVVEVMARSVQCGARGVRSKLFSAGVDTTISRVFFLRRYLYQIHSIFRNVKCSLLIHTYTPGISFKTARLLPQLWVSCAGTGLGYNIIKLWARCVPCVTHACAVCIALTKNTPPTQIAWV